MLDVKRCKSSKTKALSFYRRTAQALENCSFLFDSRRSNRDAAPHRFDDANRYALCITFTPFGGRDRNIDDPNRTPPIFKIAIFSSSVAKERLSNSFAFESFVRKQASVGESKKRKKTQVDFSRGVRSQPSNYAVYAPERRVGGFAMLLVGITQLLR